MQLAHRKRSEAQPSSDSLDETKKSRVEKPTSSQVHDSSGKTKRARSHEVQDDRSNKGFVKGNPMLVVSGVFISLLVLMFGMAQRETRADTRAHPLSPLSPAAPSPRILDAPLPRPLLKTAERLKLESHSPNPLARTSEALAAKHLRGAAPSPPHHKTDPLSRHPPPPPPRLLEKKEEGKIEEHLHKIEKRMAKVEEEQEEEEQEQGEEAEALKNGGQQKKFKSAHILATHLRKGEDQVDEGEKEQGADAAAAVAATQQQEEQEQEQEDEDEEERTDESLVLCNQRESDLDCRKRMMETSDDDAERRMRVRELIDSGVEATDAKAQARLEHKQIAVKHSWITDWSLPVSAASGTSIHSLARERESEHHVHPSTLRARLEKEMKIRDNSPATGGSESNWRGDARQKLDEEEAKIEKLSFAPPRVEPAASPKLELQRAVSELQRLGQAIPQAQLDKAFDTVAKLESALFHTSRETKR